MELFKYFFNYHTSGVFEQFNPAGPFSLGHIILTVICLPVLVLLLYKLRDITKEKLWKFMKISAIVVLSIYAFNVLYLVIIGEFDLKRELPFHLCSVFMYVLPIAAFTKEGIIKRISINTLCTVCLVGGIAGYLLPYQLYYFPVFNFFALYTLLHHLFMILVALLLFMRGEFAVTRKNLLLVLIPVALIFTCALISNFAFGGDYMFANDARETPFAVLHESLPWGVFMPLMLVLNISSIFIIGYILWLFDNWLDFSGLFPKEPTVLEIIKKRRSIRKYDPQGSVSEEQIKTLLEAAMYAPSACNIRPWEFLVVRNRELLDKISEFHAWAKMLKTAQAAIIVCARPDMQTGKAGEGMWQHDCGAATENILLQAAAMDLGTCWCGLHPVEKYMTETRKLFKLEKAIMPFCVIAVGVPAEKFGSRGHYEENKVKWL